MTRVVAPNRLHFGLLNLAPPQPAARQYGGVGMMIEAPGVAVRVQPAGDWEAGGPGAERALSFARQAAAYFRATTPAFRVEVERSPPEHVGLGVGTQLGLAVARAIALELGIEHPGVEALAAAVGRGERSGIGVHGFARGGLIVDGGRAGTGPAPLLVRHEFPPDWRIVLVRSRADGGLWAGDRERQVFTRVRSAEELLPLTERMCRILLLGILPSLLDRDGLSFGESVSEYNRLAGRMFLDDQHGEYASPLVAELVNAARRHGATGAGQSSWGPTVFAVCQDEAAARRVATGLDGEFTDLETTVTRADNTGATWDRPGAR